MTFSKWLRDTYCFETDMISNILTAEDNGIQKRNMQLIEKMIQRGDTIRRKLKINTKISLVFIFLCR